MAHFTRREFVLSSSAAAIGASLSRAWCLSRPDAKAPAYGWQYASASTAAHAIRSKQVSSFELTKLMLDRIEKLNPRINAIVTVTAEQALQRAREADAALASGKYWGPLHGVPGTIKDSFETRGVRTTAGAPFLKDYIPKQDALSVARLRSAGMVILGKTNVPLMSGDWQSYNDLFPTANNPWDLQRTPGGSTGGGAAATAAGLGYLTIGSDVGGSIRVPAHFCGVFGHKPTVGVVPIRGHVPPPPGTEPALDLNLPVAGPLARSAADLLLALQVLGGPEPPDAVAYTWKLPPARKKSIREYRMRYVLDHPSCPVTADVKARLQSAVDALRKAGARLEEGFPPHLDVMQHYGAYLRLLLQMLLPAFLQQREQILAFNPAADDLPMIALKEAFTLSHAAWLEADGTRLQARAAWRDFFRDYDAFLMPVDFVPAFPHDHRPLMFARVLQTKEGPRRYFDQLFWAGPAILTGLPATVAPVGLTNHGLPVGIQILGPWLEDTTAIFVAQALEAEFGFRVPKGFE
jgi:amidase